jgi:uncharacterized protein with PQ loop repeat
MKIYSFLTFITGLLGNIQGIIFQITPIPTVYEGIKKGEIKNITLSYFIINYTSMTFWFNYGYTIKDFFVYALNIPGLFFFTIYINIYIYLHLEKNYFILINIFLFLLFSISYKILTPNLNILLGTIIGLISQTTTIPTMRSALLKKDSGFINISLMYVFLFGCVDWLIFGYLKKIYLMVLSNFIQGIFAVTNIFIYFWANGNIIEDHIYILILKYLMNVNEKDEKSQKSKDNKEEKIQILKKNYGYSTNEIDKNMENSYNTFN